MNQNLIPSLDQMPSRTKILERPDAILLLHDSKYRALIRFFMVQPASIQTAARATNQSVQRTYNYVQRLIETDFLEIKHTEARAGKAIKHYQATSDDFFVPFIYTQSVGYADMIEQELRPLQSQMFRAFEHHLAHRNPLEWGTRLFLDPSGFTHLSFTPKENWQDFEFLNDMLKPTAPAMTNFWGRIQLPPLKAKNLQLELMELWSKYYFAAHLEEDQSQVKTYGMGLSLVPLED
jgi:hypothetical protein